MYWVPNHTVPPLNGQTVAVYNTWGKHKFDLAVWYDKGAVMEDGSICPEGDFYRRGPTGKIHRLRHQVTYYLPLEVPRPTGEEKKMNYRRGYQAGLLWVIGKIEALSRQSAGASAWGLAELKEKIEQHLRAYLSGGLEK